VSTRDRSTPARRQYPPVYEKAIPIILALLVVGFLVVLTVVVGVVLGMAPVMK
jgi:hypothetical protein